MEKVYLKGILSQKFIDYSKMDQIVEKYEKKYLRCKKMQEKLDKKHQERLNLQKKIDSIEETRSILSGDIELLSNETSMKKEMYKKISNLIKKSFVY